MAYDSPTPEHLLARLKAAEDVCLMFGWCAARTSTDREKAAHELWRQWTTIVGNEFVKPEGHPHLDDDAVTALAAMRDAQRRFTLDRIAELAAGDT